MAEPKVQLVAPIGNLTVPGINVTGVVTATTIGANVGVAGSIIQGTNLDIGAGIITATSFVGDQIGTYRAASLTGSPDLVIGVVTASSYVGDTTGAATSIMQGTNINAGTFNATTFVGNVTGNITGDVIGNASGIGASIKQGVNLNVGIATAWKWNGDGSSLTGVASSAYAAQNVTASAAETIIDLTYGNLVYLTQSSNTTVGFASTAATQPVTIVRNTNSSNTITWPDRIKWDGGFAPTLVDNPDSAAFQVFRFLSVDSGLTYIGWEEMKNSPTLYQLWTWGWNVYGELGQNNKTYRSSPVQVGTDSNWSTLDNNGGYPHWETAAIKTDGTLWTWGANVRGQLGHNNTTGYSSPKQVGTDTTWNGYPKMAYYNSVFTKSDGTLWGTGNNAYGQLGLNDVTWRSSPTQISGTTWSSGLRVNSFNKGLGILAIKTDGSLWSWGANNGGFLGLNQPGSTYISSPTQIPGTSWNTVDVQESGVMATKTDGTLWGWGYNIYGNLGDNNTTGYSSPKQIGTDTTWSDALSDGYISAALKTDGTLWSMGYNNNGGVGDNSTVQRSSPTQVGTDTTWSKIVGNQGGNSWKAIKTDGTLWSWGYNNNGHLGHNNTTKYSSPTQVPGTQWSDVGVLGAIKAIE